MQHFSICDTKINTRTGLIRKVFKATLNCMGRPRKTKETSKSVYVRFRVTLAERKELIRRAKEANAKNESAWIRQQLLGDS